VRDFARDDSAWADFLISKAALILASLILFAALFDLVAGFKELEAQEQLDFLARDFKTAVDEVGSNNSGSDNLRSGAQQDFQGESHRSFYCFEEKEIFRDSPFAGDMKVRVSGEYVCLEARSGERSFRASRPFAFRVLPFNESVLHEKLLAEFGARGSEEAPLKAGYSEIMAFIQALGTEEAVLDPGEKISLKKELIYLKDGEGVSAFGCVLVYQ
jgi:hypothetical protein